MTNFPGIDQSDMNPRHQPLSNDDRAIYEWQLRVPDFGEAGQERLKNASVLISRCGGLGSVVAYELAAAGVGKIVLAHAGTVKPSDLNRQLLMTHDWLGKPRVESAARRLNDLNPELETEIVPENVSADNVQRLVDQVDLIVDATPLFEERFALNSEAVRQRKPLVECAMYELEIQITTILPGQTPCLNCLYPNHPAAWKREFPVFGAVSGTVGCLGAMEAIKVISGIGEPLAGEMIVADLRNMNFRKVLLRRDPQCAICGAL